MQKDYEFAAIDNKVVGDRIKELRKTNRYTQQYIAEQVNVNVKTYRDWETGLREMPANALFMLSQMYSVPLTWIIGYTKSQLCIKDFIADVGNNAKAHGFREVNTNASDFVALIHSEASEVLEEFRKGKEATETYYREDGKPEGVPSELADIVIRCFDMADYYGIDLEAAILEKHKFNKSRPYLHGKKF